ncbi:unnamed protein product [Adineta steineri]|uniref:Uncharacterized protein n=1 Tax=Adineta steineri TaxID=433720 RepID=A0A814A502_9BILA|nr:unnamed protein product [Adineta steineri]CAF0906970.1 unnamed protein product [Adineta steineri]
MSNSTIEKDYIDQLSHILPLQRSFTSLERILIVCIVSIFVSFVGCTLLCLICPRSPLRRRYYSKAKLNKEPYNSVNTISRKSILEIPPSYYESIVKTNENTDYNNLIKSPYLNIVRKLSNGTVSDSDCISSSPGSDHLLSLDRKDIRSQSDCSSFSNVGVVSTISHTYPLVPYAQINVELEIDILKNLLNTHLINGEHFRIHPAFDEQAEYFIRIQLLDNKVLKKFREGWKKHRSNLSLNLWKKQQEKTTKNLSRLTDDTLTCNEFVQFQLNKNNIGLTSLRFLLFCTDRSGGLQDLMFESLIPLNPSMIPKYQQIIEFQKLPQIIFGEISVGISYLPTSERFTININKLRYFCKTEKENKTDVRLTVTFLHHGRRFFQNKIPFILNHSVLDNEIKDIIIQNIPQNKIQSVYLHLELNSTNNSSISSTSILLGQNTRYESDWKKILEHPRQTHLGWYQFLA